MSGSASWRAPLERGAVALHGMPAYASRMRWLLFVTVLPGCSFVFVHGPPENHEKLQYFDCDTGGAALTGDIAGAAWSGLTAAAAASGPDEDGERAPRSVPISFGVSSAVYVASAVYGGVNRSRCNRAKEALADRIHRDHEQHRQRLRELELQVQQQPTPSGCSKDVECKGTRICVQSQCVDPPIPSAEPSPTSTTPAQSPVPPGNSGSPASGGSQDPVPPEPQGNLGQFPLLPVSQP